MRILKNPNNFKNKQFLNEQSLEYLSMDRILNFIFLSIIAIFLSFGLIGLVISPTVFAQDNQDMGNNDEWEEWVCMTLYDPVCWLVAVECVTQPCEPVPETFSNRCFLDNNERAEYLFDGECADETVAVGRVIHNNIAEISPVDPVLWGSWYVIELEFDDNQLWTVVYEDGHIQESFSFTWEVTSLEDDQDTNWQEQVVITVGDDLYRFVDWERLEDDDDDTWPIDPIEQDRPTQSWRAWLVDVLQRWWEVIRMLFL